MVFTKEAQHSSVSRIAHQMEDHSVSLCFHLLFEDKFVLLHLGKGPHILIGNGQRAVHQLRLPWWFTHIIQLIDGSVRLRERESHVIKRKELWLQSKPNRYLHCKELWVVLAQRRE